jgi:hypothetical protein
VEAKLIKDLISIKVAKFILQDIISKYNLFKKLKVNNRAKFKGEVIKEL